MVCLMWCGSESKRPKATASIYMLNSVELKRNVAIVNSLVETCFFLSFGEGKMNFRYC